MIRAATEQISFIEIDFDESLVVDPHTHDDHVDSFLVLHAPDAGFVADIRGSTPAA